MKLRRSGFHLLCGKPVLFMGFSGLYYTHYLQALLGVDSFNCLHWNDSPCKTEHEQNLRFATHLSRQKVSPSETGITVHLPTPLKEMRVESQGAGKGTPSTPGRLQLNGHTHHAAGDHVTSQALRQKKKKSY